MDLKEYISIDPNQRFGKPCIKGTRISIFDILNWLSVGMSHDEILSDFPQLKEVHIFAALAYAANKDSITVVAAG